MFKVVIGYVIIKWEINNNYVILSRVKEIFSDVLFFNYSIFFNVVL